MDPPLLAIHSSILFDILSIKFISILSSMEFQASTIAFTNYSLLEYNLPLKRLFITDHKFSIGFRSGE